MWLRGKSFKKGSFGASTFIYSIKSHHIHYQVPIQLYFVGEFSDFCLPIKEFPFTDVFFYLRKSILPMLCLTPPPDSRFQIRTLVRYVGQDKRFRSVLLVWQKYQKYDIFAKKLVTYRFSSHSTLVQPPLLSPWYITYIVLLSFFVPKSQPKISSWI